MKQTNKNLLVIIVTYNAMKWIDRCINSLQSSTIANDIFIVDNGSTDGTRDYIKKTYPDTFLYECIENLGFGRANNIGLAYAVKRKYEYIYLLNQDAWVMHDTFEKLIQESKEHPDYGILSPMQLQANLKHFDSNFGGNIAKWENREKLAERLYFEGNKGLYDVPGVMAAHWLLTLRCVSKVGGFSPSFPHYGEDDNYAERTLRRGFRIGVVLGAKAVHDREGRSPTSKHIVHLSYIRMISALSGWHQNILREFLSYILRCMKHAVKYRTLTPISNLFKLLKNLRKIKYNKNMSERDQAFIWQDI